ncbi:kinase [Vibrio phage phi-A318]|uniref:Protein kinase n=2 Tax=Kaohsiungvirus TaxID=2731674 RepID=A0A067YIX7_9CAUD|nr:kinase [Vibrio phage phi-A318]YP_009783872.1 kinase [Vibrio phage AS51]AGZ17777.1 protein kinase [Vibrio phage phi-A318]AHC94048.1 protein kinase [Vibrio phage AS51]
MLTFENPIVRELINLADSMVRDVREGDYIDYQVRDFEKTAKEQGYVKLGSGFFSQAWTHPEIKNYAIKLGFKKEDSGAAYAAFCRDNQDLEGIPTIYGLERFSSCYVVLMDKLVAYDKLTRIFKTKREYYRAAGKTALEYPAFMKQFGKLEEIFYCNDNDESLPIYKTAIRVRDFFRGIAKFDLHSGNVMVDKFGHLVITDPVSFVKTCKQEHHAIKRNPIANPFVLPNHAHAADAAMIAEEIAFRKPFPFQNIIIDELNKCEWNECRKPKIEKGATNSKKPAFLVAHDARQGIKRNK